MAASRQQAYAQALGDLPREAWSAYLRRESALPGPRGNLELLHAAADVGDAEQFLAWIAKAPYDMAGDDPGILPLMAGLVGVGRLLAEGDETHLTLLRSHANDPRWRVREAVAMALQRLGAARIERVFAVAEVWAQGTLLERRAAVAGVCEPELLRSTEAIDRALALLDSVTASLKVETNRRTDAFRVLRQTLGYAWSVALAAAWPRGRDLLASWARDTDQDIRWVVRANLKKKRLLRVDPIWVEALASSLLN